MIANDRLNFSVFFWIAVFTVFLFSQSLFSQTNKNQMIVLKKRIAGQEKNLKVLNQNLVQLERDLGKGHERYIQVIKKRQDLERLLEESKNQAKLSATLLDEQMEKTKKTFASVLASEISKEDGDSSDIMSNQVLIKSFEKNMRELTLQIQKNNSIVEKIEEIEKSYLEYVMVEEEVADFIKSLQEEKKVKESDYIASGKKEVELKGQYQSMQRKSLQNKEEPKKQVNVAIKFMHPLEQYDFVTPKQKKGVFVGLKSLTSKTTLNVVATQTGKIVYADKLADFGNLIMIDHGDDIRSVILGEFDILVNNSAQVIKGEKIGLIKNTFFKEGIYFEVRVNNIVKETKNLLEK